MMIHKLTGLLGLTLATTVFADDYLMLIQLERHHAYQDAYRYYDNVSYPNTDLDIVMARIDIHAKDYVRAQRRLQKVILENPQQIDAFILLIGVLQHQGQYYQALNYIALGQVIHPFEPTFYIKKQQLQPLLSNTKPPLQIGIEAVANQHIKWSGRLKDYPPAEAIAMAQKYLAQYPNDADVALELSGILFTQHQYHAVINLLLPQIKQYPNYLDLRLRLINAYIQTKNYQQALSLCEQGLKRDKNNTTLIKKQQDIQYLLAPTEAKSNSPEVPSGPKPLDEKQYLNELGVFEQLYYISDVRKAWDYTSAFYGRDTKFGKLYGRVNYANRLKHEANQYAVEFFPKLGKYIYLDLYAGFANQPILFPNYTYSGEAFVVFPKLFDFSIGGQFNHIINDLQYSRFTVSISKQILKDLTLTFKPYFYFPGSGDNSILYTMSFRHMLSEPWLYWGCMLGTGTTPDLANFETVNFLVLKNPIIVSPYLNFSLFHDQFLINTSFLYQHQLFPKEFKRVRDWIGGTLGVTWRF